MLRDALPKTHLYRGTRWVIIELVKVAVAAVLSVAAVVLTLIVLLALNVWIFHVPLSTR